MPAKAHFLKIAIQAALPGELAGGLTYAHEAGLERGTLVQVPLRGRVAQGIVLGKCADPPEFECKNVIRTFDEYGPLSTPFVDWLEWLSEYYMFPMGLMLSAVLPPLKKASKKSHSSRKPSPVPKVEIAPGHPLNEEQMKCYEEIRGHERFSTHLLYGVTGSGKTEVYLSLLERVLAQGKSALVLVPEISLTPQLTNRFSRRFGDQIAVLHSQLTDRERTDQWWEMFEGRKKILIGARSALFCPLKNIGMIVVDEEHEPSYKQEEKLRYHGRDAAVMLGYYHNCPVVLGSATPSLESWRNVREKKYHLHEMKKRVEDRSMPQIQILDMRLEKEKDLVSGWLSQPLLTQITQALQEKLQIALFLNRRGISQTVLCKACGHTKYCPNCDVSLTLHSHTHLICHYCDYHENFTHKCPDCGEKELEALGVGTELIESDLRSLFPEARISRADRDEIQNRLQMEELILRMEKNEIDILIGTQMIAKGLDFPNLKLVGLVLADVGFNIPDFRATERSYQIITQMSGRSGRHIQKGESPGLVLVQTYNPSHPSIRFSQSGDYVGFAEQELKNRSELGYPPYGRLVHIRITGPNKDRVLSMAMEVSRRGRYLKKKFQPFGRIEILGPAPAPLSKLRGKYRYQVLLKGLSSKVLHEFCLRILVDSKWIASGVQIHFDIDPYHLL